MQLITLTTDFGARDWFVGTMKGVIAGLAPKARVIDITHEIPPGDIRAGALALASSCRFFPKGSVHVAVVDPGVGSERRVIAVKTATGFFVGPDNGVLSWAVAKEKVLAMCALENEDYFLRPVSRTFHGRDIFAPVAAHLSRGVTLGKLGPRLEAMVRLDWPEPRQRGRRLEGQVVYVDRFGNALTNIAAEALDGLRGAGLEVLLGRKRLCPVADCYQAVPRGQAVAVIGSSGLLELAVNQGSAARRLGLRVGQRVTVRAAGP